MNRLIIGITGASGAPLAVTLLEQLRQLRDLETHVIVSHCGALTLRHEMHMELTDIARRCTRIYPDDDYGAAPASGSFQTMGMVIIPCSMKTLAGVATGYCDTLLLRAADVTLKEQRTLVIVPRESPFSTLHLRNLTTVSELGACIIPPVPAYYNHPQTISDVNAQVSGKVLSRFGLGEVREWRGM